MRTVVLDAGALIALDHNRRDVWAMLRVAADDQRLVQVPAGAVAQAWRDGARQVLLARALRHCHEVPLDGVQARAAGNLCGAAATSDVIDASVAVVAAASSTDDVVSVLTSHPQDITRLLGTLGAPRVHVVAI